jgi:DNA-binding response OmpR family regulator
LQYNEYDAGLIPNQMAILRSFDPLTTLPTVLLIEGRKAVTEHLTPVLNGQGEYNVITAHTRREALSKAQKTQPAVIVLDSTSVRFSCRRFCETLRDEGWTTPILMLLHPGEKIDRSIGARAHLRYPISAKKLMNRINRLLPAPDDDIIRVGDVVLNIKQRCVTCGDRESHLTPKQSQLLEIFLRHPGEILTRAYLMKQIWNTDYMGDTRTLDVHIHWVRKAIEDDYKSPAYVHTVRRIGYRFEIPDLPTENTES